MLADQIAAEEAALQGLYAEYEGLESSLSGRRNAHAEKEALLRAREAELREVKKIIDRYHQEGSELDLNSREIAIQMENLQRNIREKHYEDLARRLGGIDKVPRLSPKVYATNNLEQVVENNDFLFLSVTMDRLPEILNQMKPILERKSTHTCFISAIKGLTASEINRLLITPSRLIRSNFFTLKDRFDVVSIGNGFIGSNRRELTSFYNFDDVGIEICGALKNIAANLKGVTDCLDLGDSIPGTIFSRSGVEMRSLSRLLGGSFQAFQSQAGVGDMYVTFSSDASKNHRYGRFFYELFTGNSIETHLKVLQRIDGKPEGPNTILNVHKFLEKRNMYSPIFHCAYKIFNKERSREEIREQILQATQFDRRTNEFIGPLSRLLYRLFPNLWYRRNRGFLANQ